MFQLAHAPRRSVAVRLFLTCWVVFALHFATNIEREVFPVLSLGDNLSFDVSEYLGLHDDLFELPGRGGFINNNPGASIMGAFPYVLARPIIDPIVKEVQAGRAASLQPPRNYRTPNPAHRDFYRKAYERGLDVKLGLAAGVAQIFLMAPLSALAAAVMFQLLATLTSSVRVGLALGFLYAFATPVFFRTAQLNHNLLVAHCALFAFALLWSPASEGRRPGSARFFLAGILSGWAVVLDYSGLIVLLFLGLYALIRASSPGAESRWRGALNRFALGALLSLSVLFGYQWLAFGNPFFPAQHHMPPGLYSDRGYRGMDWPHLDLLWDTAFGLQFGLFTSAPLLLLSLYVPAWFRRHGRLPPGRETGIVLGLCLAYFLFSAANQYGRWQFVTGVRHVVPVGPFLFLIAAGMLTRMPTRVAVLVGAASTYWSWCLSMYREVAQGLGVFDAVLQITRGGPRLPWLTTLERMGYVPEGVFVWPALAIAGVTVWMLWTVRGPRLTGVPGTR